MRVMRCFMTRKESREQAFILLFEYSFSPDTADELFAVADEAGLYVEDAYCRSVVEQAIESVAEIDAMSAKIGKLYLVSRSTAKTVVDDAQASAQIVDAQTDKSLQNIESTQASLKELAEEILSASQGFVSRIGEFNRTLEDAKSKVDENKSNSMSVSEEFAELYAKL